MAEVTQKHRELAVEAWRLSNDPAGEGCGPELVAQAIADAEQRGRSEAEGWVGPGTFPDEDSWAWVDCGGASEPRPMQWRVHHWWGSDSKGNPLALRMGHVVRYSPLPPPPVPSEVEK